MNHADIEVRIYEVSRSSGIVIHDVFDSALSPDEAADKVREIWKDYVMPIQAGLAQIYAPTRTALEAGIAWEQGILNAKEQH